MYRIGIDVGGTNTDAVVMNGDEVVHAVKTATSADVMAGVLAVLRQVISGSGVRAADLRAVMIGTTHFTNAIVERRALARVGVIRLALPATQSLPPLSGWPDDIAAAVGADRDGAPRRAPPRADEALVDPLPPRGRRREADVDGPVEAAALLRRSCG